MYKRQRIDLSLEHCCWHSSARATTQRIAAPPTFSLPLVFEPGERLMAGVSFVCEGVVARRCGRRRTRPCVFVCCAFYCCCCCCCCCCCSCTRGFVVWLVWMCKVWFSSCPGSESLPLRLQQSEFRGGQSPHHLSPIFYKKLKNVSCEYNRVNG